MTHSRSWCPTTAAARSSLEEANPEQGSFEARPFPPWMKPVERARLSDGVLSSGCASTDQQQTLDQSLPLNFPTLQGCCENANEVQSPPGLGLIWQSPSKRVRKAQKEEGLPDLAAGRGRRRQSGCLPWTPPHATKMRNALICIQGKGSSQQLPGNRGARPPPRETEEAPFEISRLSLHVIIYSWLFIPCLLWGEKP